MSITKISDTQWEHEFDVGGHNDTHTITALPEGLEICYDLIPWEDIEKAKLIVKK